MRKEEEKKKMTKQEFNQKLLAFQVLFDDIPVNWQGLLEEINAFFLEAFLLADEEYISYSKEAFYSAYNHIQDLVNVCKQLAEYEE